MFNPEEQFRPGDILLIVDVQRDFCPGGALPIEDGDQVVPVANQWIKAAQEADCPVYLSRDWHPGCHLSFKEYGGQWPVHCLQDSSGAAFHPDLVIPEEAVIITKGTRLDQDQNSAFDQTGLAPWLRSRRVKRIFVAGLAQDVCVLATVLDGIREGFDMVLIESGTRPVTKDAGQKALDEMRRGGTTVIS